MKRSGTKLRRLLAWTGASIVGVVVVSLLTLRLTLGGGEPYPDISTDPLIKTGDVEVLVELEFPPGNVTSSAQGRIFVNLHPFAAPARFTETVVSELVDGKLQAFPDEAFQQQYKGVLGMTVDRQDRLWMIEPPGLEDRATRLFGFDLNTNELVVDRELGSEVGMFSQDLRVSPDGNTMFLADTGAFFLADPALIVLDLKTMSARRVLEGHPSILPQDWEIRTADGPYKLAYGLVNFSVGIDGLALSHDGAWLYYAAMSHDSAYRIATQHLLDPDLSADALAAHVQLVGSKPLSDGIELDAHNNLYITDIENGGIARLGPDGVLTTLTKDASLVWADGVNLSSDGWMYFTDSEIPAYVDPLLRPPARARVARAAPHRVFRVRIPEVGLTQAVF